MQLIYLFLLCSALGLWCGLWFGSPQYALSVYALFLRHRGVLFPINGSFLIEVYVVLRATCEAHSVRVALLRVALDTCRRAVSTWRCPHRGRRRGFKRVREKSGAGG